MEFTNREILEAIAAAIGLLFILYGWHFIDNRRSHQTLHQRINDLIGMFITRKK